jgi:DnaJ-domain-containing protein 1
MKDYYRILELPESADVEDIKRAYRRLAKLYHPDLNDDPSSARRFILINEAYEFLSDDRRRAYYRARRATRVSDAELERREAYYREWAQKQQQAARQRAEQYARADYDAFTKSKVYRTAMVMNRVYNYVFLGMGIFMIVAALIYVIRDGERLLRQGESVGMLLLPGFIGVMFTLMIWYFLFKQKL